MSRCDIMNGNLWKLFFLQKYKYSTEKVETATEDLPVCILITQVFDTT